MNDINRIAKDQIDEIKLYCLTYKPLVVVWSFVYNHGEYLKDYFEGIIKQQCNFKYLLLVHDDASTDNSSEIIKKYAEKYPHIIRPIFELDNQYSKGNGTLERIMLEAIRSSNAKYTAFCEGDDYWIDPLKLQKQVDFLETHPDYGLVHTNFQILNQSTKKIINNGSRKYHIVNGSVFESLFNECFIKTLTVLCKTNLISNLYPPNNKMFLGDRYLFFELSLHSKFYYINEESSVYRLLKNSASHIPDPAKRLNMYKSLESLDNYYLSNNNVDKKITLNVRKKWFITYLKHYITVKDYESFKLLQNNGNLKIYKNPILYLVYILGKNRFLFNVIIKTKDLLKNKSK